MDVDGQERPKLRPNRPVTEVDRDRDLDRMVCQKLDRDRDRPTLLTLSIDTSLPSKWRLLNVLEFPSTYLPPKKSAIAKVFLSLGCSV